LRADHDRIAGLRTACLREVLPLLTEASREALFAPEFITATTALLRRRHADEPAATGVCPGRPRTRTCGWPTIATTPLTPRATVALVEFGEVCDATARTIRLTQGDLVIVDNRVTVHGRTAFHPRYDGADRWLQRTFVIADLPPVRVTTARWTAT